MTFSLDTLHMQSVASSRARREGLLLPASYAGPKGQIPVSLADIATTSHAEVKIPCNSAWCVSSAGSVSCVALSS
jgi:hypothetical protein